MKCKNTRLCSIVLSLFIVVSLFGQAKTDEKRKYLKQKPPSITPEIFGEGIVSVEGRFDMGFTISPDGNNIVFGVADEINPDKTCIYLMSYVNKKWTSPSKSFLQNNISTFFPMFAPTGKELYFAKSIDDSETDIWVATFAGNKAVNAQPLDSTINSNSREAGHGLSRSGAFYFTSNRNDQNQCCGDIYNTQLESNTYYQVKKSEVLSSEADEESLFLSPDEDYIIIQAWKNEFESKHDLYISYRTKRGSWTVPNRLNSKINSKEIEQRPFISPDNRFLFFSRMSISNNNGQEVYDSDIYWVSTKSVFGPYVYNSRVEASLKYSEEFELKLPDDIFDDIDDKELSYKLTLEDNTQIPVWLEFDSNQLILSGKWNTQKILKLKLTATDTSGNFENFKFELKEKRN